MKWFGTLHAILHSISERSPSNFLKFIALLLCLPCFKLSHAFFKLAYSLNQLRLRRLCGENFFLKFYNRPVAGGDIVDIMQSLRHIKRGLQGANTSKGLSLSFR
jgi:hypothetical protein